MAVYLFYAFFVASKQGKTGLSPTVDVYGPGGAEVTGANATTIGGGLYSYSHTDAVDGDYSAVFKTADATVDQQWIPALAVKQISAYIDAAISSRAVAGDLMGLANDAITAGKFDESTAFPLKAADTGATIIARPGDLMGLASDAITSAKFDESTAFPVKSADTGATQIARTGADADTLETLSDQIDLVDPADVWAYATRTLTQSAASVAAAVVGSNITAQRGDTLVAALTGLGNISTRTKLWLAVKSSLDHTDAQSILFLEETAGLTAVNGAVYAVITDASIVVTNAATGALTITIKPAVTKDLPLGSYHYDMQYLTAAGVVTTITASTFTASGDVTRAVS
jgi:hypothetical protein